MIFSTNNQLNCFLIFLFLGILTGLIFNFFFVVFLKKHQKNIKKIIFDTIFCLFFYVFYIFLINIFNLGIFSLSLLSAFSIGFFFEKKVSFNLVVFLENKWYNTIKRKTKHEEQHKPN